MSAVANEKLTEALKLLEEAAVEKKEEIKGMLTAKCRNLKDLVISSEMSGEETLAALKKKVTDAAKKIQEVSVEKSKEIASTVDESAHKNPWYFIGGAAIGGLLLGYILGKKN